MDGTHTLATPGSAGDLDSPISNKSDRMLCIWVQGNRCILEQLLPRCHAAPCNRMVMATTPTPITDLVLHILVDPHHTQQQLAQLRTLPYILVPPTTFCPACRQIILLMLSSYIQRIGLEAELPTTSGH